MDGKNSYCSENEIDFVKLSYQDFASNNKNEELDGLVIVFRDDCKHCDTMFDKLKNNFGCIEIDKKFYIIDGAIMSMEEKEDFFNLYGISSVPSLMLYDDGELKSIEIGVMPDDEIVNLVAFMKGE